MNQLLTTKPALRLAAVRSPRRGFTLIELMVVIAILLVVTVATLPVLNPNSGQRLLREAARTVAETLNAARNRAIATGRPVGVWFEPAADGLSASGKCGASQILYLCEQPSPYAGDTLNATVKVTANQMGDASTSTSTPVAKIHFIPDIEATLKQLGVLENNANGKLSGGPYFIRIGGSGPAYRLENQGTSPTAARFFTGTGVNKLATISNPSQTPPLPTGTPFLLPAPVISTAVATNDSIAGVPFQITRSPIKSADPPIQLPAAVCVDLTQSGITQLGGNGAVETVFMFPWPITSTSWPVNPTGVAGPTPVGQPLTPVVIWFGPNGALQRIYWGVTTSAGATTYYSAPSSGMRDRPSFVHFLIGRRELVFPPTENPTVTSGATSLVDGNLGRPTSTTTRFPEAMPGDPGPSANFWVTIGASGQVTVAENIDPTNSITTAISNSTRSNTMFQLGTARSRARAQQQTGGVK